MKAMKALLIIILFVGVGCATAGLGVKVTGQDNSSGDEDKALLMNKTKIEKMENTGFKTDKIEVENKADIKAALLSSEKIDNRIIYSSNSPWPTFWLSLTNSLVTMTPFIIALGLLTGVMESQMKKQANIAKAQTEMIKELVSNISDSHDMLIGVLREIMRKS